MRRLGGGYQRSLVVRYPALPRPRAAACFLRQPGACTDGYTVLDSSGSSSSDASAESPKLRFRAT